MVACYRCATSEPRSDDTEPHVRKRRNCPRSSAYCHWSGAMQDHEGKWVSARTIISDIMNPRRT